MVSQAVGISSGYYGHSFQDRDRQEKRDGKKNSRVKKGLTGLLKDQCLKTLFSIESEVLGVPKFWHAPNPPVGLSAPFHILRDGLDVTDEWGDPGPRFKCC